MSAHQAISKATRPKLPILDIAKYYTDRQSFVEGLRHACHRVGFFLVKHSFDSLAISEGDGSNEEQAITTRMLTETRNFFERPTSQKMEISYDKSPCFRGYMKIGVENTSGKIDYREQIEYAVEYPASSSDNMSWPVYERLKCPSNPWPNSFQPTLQPITKEFANQVCHVADIIRDSLCLALDLKPSVLTEMFQHETEIPHWVIKMVSYPPSSEIADGSEQGVGAHTDTNFLTLVLQDGVGGLQAFSQGEWIDVPVEDNQNLLVCNLGEQAEIWSRGYFLATPHRVLRNSSATKARISVPLFYNPVLSAKIQPLEDRLLEGAIWERPDDYKEKQHWKRQHNTMLTSVGENTFKSLARSHPTVFNKHHPDLKLNADGSVERITSETT